MKRKNLFLGIGIAFVVIMMVVAISDDITGFASKTIKKGQIKKAASLDEAVAPIRDPSMRGIIPDGSKCLAGEPIGKAIVDKDGKIVAKCNIGYICVYVGKNPQCISTSSGGNLVYTTHETATHSKNIKAHGMSIPFAPNGRTFSKEFTGNSLRYSVLFARIGSQWPVGRVDYSNWDLHMESVLDLLSPSPYGRYNLWQNYYGLRNYKDIEYSAGNKENVDDSDYSADSFGYIPELDSSSTYYYTMGGYYIYHLVNGVFVGGVYPFGVSVLYSPEYILSTSVYGLFSLDVISWARRVRESPEESIGNYYLITAECARLKYKEIIIECSLPSSSNPINRIDKYSNKYVSYSCLGNKYDLYNNQKSRAFDEIDDATAESQEVIYRFGDSCAEWKKTTKELNQETREIVVTEEYGNFL